MPATRLLALVDRGAARRFPEWCCSLRVLLDERANGATVQPAIALRARRPHGGSFAAIEHAELQRREIGRARHDSAQRVDLARDSAFRDAADRRIARHLADRLERAGDETDARAKTRCGYGCLGAGVAGADDDDVELEFERERGHPSKDTMNGQRRNLHAHLSDATRNPARRADHADSKSAFERAGLARAHFDARYNLTPDEFRVEGELIAIGPLYDEEALGALTAELESLGLIYFEDFAELSGNWPSWLTIFARGS